MLKQNPLDQRSKRTGQVFCQPSNLIVQLARRSCLLIFLLLFAGCTTIESFLPLRPQADERAQTEAWVQSLVGLSTQEQASLAAQAWRDSARPRQLRERAAFIVSTRPGSQALAAQTDLAARYSHAPQSQRAGMERLLTADLLTADEGTLRQLSMGISANQERTFPWVLIAWQSAQRGLHPEAQRVLSSLGDPRLYADPSVVGMSRPSAQVTVSTGARSGRTALLLPLSGSFSAIGKQVAEGAKLAATHLAAKGVNLDVIIVDTEKPDWLQQLASLPSDCVVIGGPLRANLLTAISPQTMQERAFFAFLAQLPQPAAEGNTVWRFFTSAEDQVDALLNFTVNQLGIRSYGVWAPDDSYGKRMTDYFMQAATRQNLAVSTGNYPLENVQTWVKAQGEFVQTAAPAGRSRVPTSRAPFTAIFLPDSWKNMDMIISTFSYHGAHRKVMMGTTLWEQGLVTAGKLNGATFGLSVFPGVWNPQSSLPGAQQLRSGLEQTASKPSDWSVLGYDFAQFVAALGLNSAPANAQSLNARLAGGFAIDWAGAPFIWDTLGKAHRKLFLFQPSSTGVVFLNPEAFASYLSGTGKLPNAVQNEEIAPAQYNLEVLQPDLDALINTILSSGGDTVPSVSAPMQ